MGAFAQDPVKVDPNHYKVEFENSEVRVLRIKYGPHEKSVMHWHPRGVVIALTDVNGKFTFPNGSTMENNFKAGEVKEAPAGAHLPENTGDQAFELILIEMKTKPAKKSGSRKKY
jgi:quercetin dioxygenase-like cupin family protein